MEINTPTEIKVKLNRAIPYNYAIVCPDAGVAVSINYPQDFATQVTPSLIRAVKTKRLIDVYGTIKLEDEDEEIKLPPVITSLTVTPASPKLNEAITYTYEVTYDEGAEFASEAWTGNNNSFPTKGEKAVSLIITDSNGNASEPFVKRFNVVDATKPIVTLNGASNIKLTVGDTYQELGATAVDESDGTLEVVITGNVNTAVAGTYKKTYTATDLSGNVGTKARTIEVEAAPEPEPQPEPSEPEVPETQATTRAKAKKTTKK